MLQIIALILEPKTKALHTFRLVSKRFEHLRILIKLHEIS